MKITQAINSNTTKGTYYEHTSKASTNLSDTLAAVALFTLASLLLWSK